MAAVWAAVGLLMLGSVVGSRAQAVAGYPQTSQFTITADKCLLTVESVQLYSAEPTLQVGLVGSVVDVWLGFNCP